MASSGNFCVWNRNYANGGGTPDFGSITQGVKSTLGDTVFGTFGVTSGKWYWEWKLTGGGLDGGPGWANSDVNSAAELGYNSPSSGPNAQCVYVYASTGGGGTPKIIGDGPKSGSTGENSDATGSVSNNVIFGLAADFDNDKWYYSIDGSFDDMRSGQNPATGANPMCSATGGGGLVTITRTSNFFWTPAVGNWAASSTRESIANFGQDSTFLGTGTAGSGNADANGFGDFKYAVPTGFLALCSANLPTDSNIDPNQTNSNIPTKNFNVLSYSSTGGDSYTGLGFQPDLVWVRWRGGEQGHGIFDSSRGTSKVLNSDESNAEATSSGLTAFGTDGFTMGNSYNQDGRNYVAWCWRANGGTTSTDANGTITSTVQANTAGGFSIVTYTGDGTDGASIGHGLGAAPKCIFVKNRDQADSWAVYHVGTGNASHLLLDSSSGVTTSSAYWNSFTPSSTIFKVGNDHKLNASTEKYVAYCWSEVEGYQKFGSHVGNGNTDGIYVYTGFRPKMFWIKRTDGSHYWYILDSARDSYNPLSSLLNLDDSISESTHGSSNSIDILANGFKMRTSGGSLNGSGGNFIWAAWADIPYEYSTIADSE